MAENASISNAHAHARKAVEEQYRLHWSQAGEEHQRASSEFARVARSTTDSEALRVLRLLEEQHRKLASIVRLRDTASKIDTTAVAQNPSEAANRKADDDATKSDRLAVLGEATTSPAMTTTRVGSQTRDSSPSLARDMASRRGIPQPLKNQQSQAAQARRRQTSPQARRKMPNSKTTLATSQGQSPEVTSKHSKRDDKDDGFANFYATITTGTMSKLSSALAFAGLPLTMEDIPTGSTSNQRTVKATNETDVKKVFSRAALEAVEDEHRRRGTLGHGFGPAESFYVVQKGGGTYSYADIAQNHYHHEQHLSGVEEEDEDDAQFVDAKEVPGPPSPKHSRHPSSRQQQSRTAFGNPRTQEELELENTTLKQTLEQIATRLAVFEAHAQDASMAALTQSMASIRPDGGERERLRQLERELKLQTEERLRLEALASKQKEKLKKYETKWEEVRKSAKEKDRLKREKEREKAEPAQQANAASLATAEPHFN